MKDTQMANIDLTGYNLNDLKRLQAEVEKEIKDRQQQELKKARDQILAIAQDVGVSIEDLIGSTSGKPGGNAGTKAQPKYQNPADKSQNWSGRGRQPRWIVDALNNGKTLEDLKI
jgi:DNA-binding protein H-NS